jgi:hypothetical protein
LCIDDGQPGWQFMVALHASHADFEQASEALAGFRQRAPFLFFLQGDRRLLALDVRTGRVLWSCWAPGSRRLPAGQGGSFVASYQATPQVVTIQTASGYVWVLEATTGRRLREYAPPEAVGEPATVDTASPGRRPLIVVPGVREVEGLDGTTGELLWRHVLDAPTTLRGVRPRVVEGADHLLVLVPRNYAWNVQCLDPRTGQARWSSEVLLGMEEAAALSVTLDEAAFYFVVRSVLQSRSLADGTLLWECPLWGPEKSWRLRTVESGYLLVWGSGPKAYWSEVRWLCGCVRCTLALPPKQAEDDFSVGLWDRKNGRLAQRCNFAIRTPPPLIQARFASRMVLRPEMPGDWHKEEGSQPAVVLLECGVGVVTGGVVTVLKNNSSEPQP